MKVFLINGSPNKEGCTYTALKEVAAEFDRAGIETEIFNIGKKPVRGCVACYACRRNNNSRCAFDDDAVNTIIEKILEADGVVLGSPVYYAGINGAMKALLDRIFFAGRRFAGRPGASVVSCRRGGASAAFDQMNHYFTISNMPVVPSQYWNQVHGSSPEDVLEDKEGLQTMRTLGRNMAWMLRSRHLAEEKGIAFPEREEPVWTDFIRR